MVNFNEKQHILHENELWKPMWPFDFSFLLNEKSQNRTEEIQGSLNARVIIDQQYLIVEFF
jgi:hypothetical protein